MKGMHRVQVSGMHLKYDFVIKRNITIIKGDSATGKTALVRLIDMFQTYGSDSGIQLTCDCNCVVLSGNDWEQRLSYIHDSIVFIDEGSRFVFSQQFANCVRKSTNYYVIITRESLPTLPYSIKEIYIIKPSGKFQNINAVYNDLVNLYQYDELDRPVQPDTIITEDTNSGFEFMQCICGGARVSCKSAGGKSRLREYLSSEVTESIMLIADGAALGSEIDRLHSFLMKHPNYSLYAPESFEWILLRSGIFQDNELMTLLDNPEDHIDSYYFFSWERYFFNLLAEYTKNMVGWEYSKHRLANGYKSTKCVATVLRFLNKVLMITESSGDNDLPKKMEI